MKNVRFEVWDKPRDEIWVSLDPAADNKTFVTVIDAFFNQYNLWILHIAGHHYEAGKQ